MLPFKSMIDIDKKNKMPVYLQITNGIINQILKRRIAPGYKMPGTRPLAEQLSVHRNTIIACYDELEAQGWLEVKPAKGSFIIDTLPVSKAQKIKSSKRIINPLNKSSFQLNKNAKTDFGLLRQDSFDLHFDDGCPDVRIAPIQVLARHYKSLLNSKSKHKYDYSWHLNGSLLLRKALKEYLSNSRGIQVGIENIMITRGSLMGFYLFFKNLLSPGDRVLVGETSYQPVNQIIEDLGGVLEFAKVDEDGIDMEHVLSICKKKKIKAIYIVPHHHHPTTVTLSCERRMKLLDIANEFNLAVVEDDYDFDFHYDSSPILPLMSSDHNGSIVYTGSFSKTIAPAIRLGYIVAPVNVIKAMSYTRRYIDRQGDELMERALAMMIQEGELNRHIRKALIIYKERRDHFCDLVDQLLKDKITYQKPKGGLTVWAEFDKNIDLEKMVSQARKKGLFMVDPKVYNPKRKKLHASRMGFASMTKEELTRSIEILKSIL